MNNQYAKIQVEIIGAEYPVHIGAGIIGSAGDYIGDILGNIGGRRRAIIIADEAVKDTWAENLKTAIAPHCGRLDFLAVPSGEASKSIASFGQLTEDILALNIDRRAILIAVGGGVIGDLVGFVAASVLRGIDFIQVPTTLLAQVDSSVGGKTGINAAAGKNLIGAFHQPKAVIADTKSLASLPMREIRAGYAEVVKYGLLGDAGFFGWLEENHRRIFDLDDGVLIETIGRCCQAKADIVAQDETEKCGRALLNLGHTFAHAYEAEAGYDGSVLHGEAVACGIIDAYRLSVALKLSDAGDLDRVLNHWDAVGLPRHRSMLSNKLGQTPPEKLISHMKKDKKALDGKMVFIIPSGIGTARRHPNIDEADVRAILESSP